MKNKVITVIMATLMVCSSMGQMVLADNSSNDFLVMSESSSEEDLQGEDLSKDEIIADEIDATKERDFVSDITQDIDVSVQISKENNLDDKTNVMEDTGEEVIFNAEENPLIETSERLIDIGKEYVKNKDNREYIDKMINRYLTRYPELIDTMQEGYAVIFFFEGGSDKNKKGNDYKTFRDGAVEFVLTYNEENQKILVSNYCHQCNTLPDYPQGWEYDNGHENYGAGILLDGIYDIRTRIHRGTHAAFNIGNDAINNKWFVPALYQNKDGFFSILNGTAYNLHNRIYKNVSGDVNNPTSAGCLTVGDDANMNDYNKFIESAINGNYELKATTYEKEGETVNTYTYNAGSEFKPAGMVVVDRYLAKDRLDKIYGDKEAVEAITDFSTDMQADDEGIFNDINIYPSNIMIKTTAKVDIKKFPTTGEIGKVGEIKKNSVVHVIAIYDDGNCYWYKVLYNDMIGYIKTNNTTLENGVYDDITIHGAVYPVEKPYGQIFSVAGIIGTRYNYCQSIKGIIVNANGVESVVEIPGPFRSYSLNASDEATSYNESLDCKLAFSGLPVGKSKYKIVATVDNYHVSNGELQCDKKDIILLDKEFEVTDDTPRIIVGDNFDWKIGSDSSARIVCNVAPSGLNDLVIDGRKLIKDIDYACEDLGTRETAINLKPEFLSTLSVGEYMLVLSEELNLKVQFTIYSDISPDDENKIKNFVEDLYRRILGRDADEQGLSEWVAKIKDGRISAAQTTYGFFMSDEYQSEEKSTERFVNDLYKGILGRNADKEGFNDWVQILNSGSLTRQEVVACFLNSEEFYNEIQTINSELSNDCKFLVGYFDSNKDYQMQNRASQFVARFYRIGLGREPEYGGLYDWTRKIIEKEITLEELARGFIFSDEFKSKVNIDKDGKVVEEETEIPSAFVEKFYSMFFDREADEGGKDCWLKVIGDKPLDKLEELAQGFLGSDEFIKVCNEMLVVG